MTTPKLPRSLLVATTLLAAAPTAATVQTPRAFVTGVSNPEDLMQLPGTPWVVVSGMRSDKQPGRLYLLDTRHPDTAMTLYPSVTPIKGGPDAAAFAPHGINARALGTGQFELLVVDHGGSEAIDRFVLESGDGGRPTVASVSRIELPPGAWANGIAPMPDGGFVISSMYDPRDASFIDKFAAGAPTGGVWRWSPDQGWRELPSPRLSGANGIATTADGRTIIVAEWALRRIWRVPIDGGDAHFVTTSFLTDNLRWTADGDLLVAGQIAEPRDLFTNSTTGKPCPMGFAVARVDPVTLAVTPLLNGDEQSFAATGFGGATGAVEIDGMLWVGSFTGERIARFAIPAAAKD
ncbi:SMP-30/gluconolactonase/LRE family protein [Bradyrhizobium prioriisuperbiae]|uniref:SMP-30/gluconolactonase/LRE family protein n=1 Tax=Bradyrhizobium prioriisuperbiae TaxID=2854389 RepID=UPI0028E64D61|nr:SMP-30/gluconolactonase/LRE family protein [Bradyrhizobium prioritasuperba]